MRRKEKKQNKTKQNQTKQNKNQKRKKVHHLKQTWILWWDLMQMHYKQILMINISKKKNFWYTEPWSESVGSGPWFL